LASDETKLPACFGLTELFFGPNMDGRKERGRKEREQKAKLLCLEYCEHVMPCLERAMVLGEDEGVWGGMTEAERRQFKEHMISEGYRQVPTGMEFWATLNSFWRSQERNRFERIGQVAPT